MFRSLMTIISELYLYLTKVIFMLPAAAYNIFMLYTAGKDVNQKHISGL